jgi:hypothetical protein
LTAETQSIKIADNMKRPKGVTFLALLLLLDAAVNGAVLAIMLENPAQPKSDLGLRLFKLIPSLHSIDGPGLFFFSILTAIGCIVVGIGLLLLKPSARWAMLFVTIVPLARRAIGICEVAAFNPHVFWKVFGTDFWTWTLFDAAIAYYLTQPEVQKAFSQDDWELRSE